MALSAGMRQAIGIARNMRKERFGHEAAMQQQREATTMRGQDLEQARHGDTHALARERLGHDVQSHGDMMGYRQQSLGQAESQFARGLDLDRERLGKQDAWEAGRLAQARDIHGDTYALSLAKAAQGAYETVYDPETMERRSVFREGIGIKGGKPLVEDQGGGSDYLGSILGSLDDKTGGAHGKPEDENAPPPSVGKTHAQKVRDRYRQAREEMEKNRK
jgi:hypothetical protein